MISRTILIGGVAAVTTATGAGLGAFAVFGGASHPTAAVTAVKGETLVPVVGGTTPSGRPVGSATGTSGGPSTMSITGSVSGDLFPGRSLPLDLTISNPNAFKATIRSLVATPHSPGTGCPATSLTATSFSGILPIAGHGVASLTLEVTMSSAAPNACQHGVYDLTYAAEAQQG